MAIYDLDREQNEELERINREAYDAAHGAGAYDALPKDDEENEGDDQETLSLTSMPGMSESIIAGGTAPLDECLSEDEVDW